MPIAPRRYRFERPRTSMASWSFISDRIHDGALNALIEQNAACQSDDCREKRCKELARRKHGLAEEAPAAFLNDCCQWIEKARLHPVLLRNGGERIEHGGYKHRDLDQERRHE